MKNKSILALIVAGMISLAACSSNSVPVSSGDAVVSATETTATTTEAAPENYVHGEDGYYCIADELPDFQMRQQDGGTCWLFSAVAGMESSYAKKTGKYISVDPMELLDIVYDDEKAEGFFLDKGMSKKDFGGGSWIVTQKFSSGFCGSSGVVIDSSIVIDPTDRETIKQALRSRGAVSIGTLDNPLKQGGFGGYFTMNDPTGVLFDHDVAIIGYDDHFPKQYFKTPASEDGAWICYNSAKASWGLYYISYCSPFENAISHTVTDRYSDVLAYDAGNEQSRLIKTGTATTTANVFHKAGKLAAIGTYNDCDRQDITIEIYDDTFTNLLYSQSAVLDYHGYGTVELDTPVEVSDYAIAVTYCEGAPVEGDKIDYDQLHYVTVSESGQSFVKLDTWHDLTENDISSKLGIDFKPGNACIKALYE